VLDENHLAAVRYVELSPVQAGMVAHAWKYPWSSAGFPAGWTESDPLVKDRTLSGLITDWEGFLAGGITDEFDRLRMTTQTGRPSGDDIFIAKVENMTGRDLSKGAPGRPRKQQ